MIVPVIVLEKRRAGESFGRSHELVRGHGWVIFGLIVVVFLLGAIVSGIISGLLQAALNDFLGFWIGSTVANAIVTPFFAVALTVAYLQLTRAGDTEAAV